MRLLNLILCLTVHFSAVAQGDGLLSKFEVLTSGNKTVVSWTTSAGFTCQNLQIQHGTDSNNFETIYTHPGICGINNESVTYFYEIEQVLPNGSNYFRINLGTFGYSKILTTAIIQLAGYQTIVKPNPANSNSEIHFNNDEHLLATIKLISLNGTTSNKLVNTTDNHINLLEFGDLTSGYYFYFIELGTINVSGRFFLK